MIWGGSRQWKGNGTVEDEGLVLGEIGEAKGRGMEAGKGVELLEKREEVLQKIFGRRREGNWVEEAGGLKSLSGMSR